MKKILLTLFLLHSFYICGQDSYPVSSIPENLKANSHAVVRFEQIKFIQTDLNNATEEVTRVITILNEKGKDQANLFISQDQFRELKNFSGEIILASGKIFKKLGKNDLSTTGISPHLASDDVWTYYQCDSPSYPFTVKYSYQIRWKEGISWYPTFVPASFSTAIEKAEYRIQVPATESIRYKGNQYTPELEKQLLGKDSIYTWKCENIQAIVQEPLAPSLFTLTPVIYASPKDFCFDGYCGKMNNWNETGIFLSQLLDKRDILPPASIEKVKEITRDITDDKEKVKRIYEYLQSTCRYVSIQLGIGGYQPIPANRVAQTGYGDCKGLSNYMKAMLNVVNIPSLYAIVHTKNRSMFPDFSSMTQANHAILMVPLENDSIWMECTSRDLPFGYIHNDIAGHDALLIDGDKSKLVKITDIPDSLNWESNRIHLDILPDASIQSSVTSIYNNHQIEGINLVLNMPEKEKITSLSKELAIQKTKITNIQMEYIKRQYPEISVNYDLTAEHYANITGSRLFVPVNPFRFPWGKLFSSSSRTLDIVINTPVIRTDSILINMPEQYTIESMPAPSDVHTACGSFSSRIELEENRILIIQKITIPRGSYPATTYDEIKDFFRKAGSAFGNQLVLKRKE